jgi:hypothetical protein
LNFGPPLDTDGAEPLRPYIVRLWISKGAAFIESGRVGALSVHVKYDVGEELDMPEDRYRARGYQPPFDQLPWKDEIANDNA